MIIFYRRSLQIIPKEYRKFRIILANLLLSATDTFISIMSRFSPEESTIDLNFNDSEDKMRRTSVQEEIDDMLHRICKILLSAVAGELGEYTLLVPFGSASTDMLEKIAHNIVDGSIFLNNGDVGEVEDFMSIVILRNQKIEYIFALLDTIARTRQLSSASLSQIVIFACKNCLRNVEIQREIFPYIVNLLSSVCKLTPRLCGIVMREIHSRFIVVQEIALDLFKKLPIHNWIPTHEEVIELENMLKDPLDSPKSILARFVIGKISWNQPMSITLESRKHLALAIVNTYLDYEGRKNSLQRTSVPRAIFTSAIEMTQKLSSIPFGENLFLEFHKWTWTILCKLDFYSIPDFRHTYHIPPGSSWAIKPFEHSDSPVLITVKGFAQSNPVAAYGILSLSEIGQNFDLFKKEGWNLLKVLLDSNEPKGFLDCSFNLFCSFAQTEKDLYQFPEVFSLFGTFWKNFGSNTKTIDECIVRCLERGNFSAASVHFWDQLVLFDNMWTSSTQRQRLLDQLIPLVLEFTSVNEILKDLNIKYKELFFRNGSNFSSGPLNSLLQLASSRFTLQAIEDYPSLLDACSLSIAS